MLVLFDHSVPAPLVPYLIGHSVTEARTRGWDTLSNGDLLIEAKRAGFDVFVTADKNIQYQQNLSGRKNSCCGAEHSAVAGGSIAHGQDCGCGECDRAWQLCGGSDSVEELMELGSSASHFSKSARSGAPGSLSLEQFGIGAAPA